jgi:hypothetical protein
LSKTTLIIVLPKLILDTYLGAIASEIPSSPPVTNIVSEAPNETKNSSTLITLFELPILLPSINFQSFKHNRNSEVKTTTNQVTRFSAAKHKLDNKTDKP